MARHKHNYAISDSIDGKSLYVNISVDNANKTFLVNNNDEQGKLTCSEQEATLQDEEALRQFTAKAKVLGITPSGRKAMESRAAKRELANFIARK